MNEQLCEMFCRHIKSPIDIALLHFRVKWQAHISGEDKDKDTGNGILWQTEVLRKRKRQLYFTLQGASRDINIMITVFSAM